ncbi:MAG: DUF4783 domain-containing protein [Chitinophagaceae bacterium]|jgi:hypothetical protein|nr:DUF4783 domain-containing protein [Chitinophagaceae bacterium]
MKVKHLFSFLLLVSLVVTITSFTQKEEIVAALKTGSVDKMAKYFDNMVDVSVPGKSNTFSKGQAEMVLKDFFTLNRVRNFEIQHSGSNPSSNFIIGTLTTAGGNYRTTVYMRTKGDKQLMQGIEFELK